MTLRLDFSLGPVQPYIAASRRTRDLWGSSYLLAFLAGHAMRGVQEVGGTVVQPLVEEEPLCRWILGQGNGQRPKFGSLPNRFAAEIDEDRDASAVARSGVAALTAAWERIADAVWERYMDDATELGYGTRAIWDRQVASFWEVSWTVGESRGKDKLPPLARRKQWRSHRNPDEPGDKCTVMSTFQELSGHIRAAGAREREVQDEFWRRLRGWLGGPINLRDHERLCAIALITRTFADPSVSENAIGWKVDAGHWPSTTYIGAVPWIREACAHAPEEAAAYARCIAEVSPKSIGAPWPLRKLEGAGECDNFPRLDGNCLHRRFIADARRFPVERDDLGDIRDGLLRALKALQDAPGESGSLGAPPTFYAILLADGDRLGRLVSELTSVVVSRALSRFTQEVEEVVRRRDGVTVYAGGDDLLCMLPAESAIRCAEEVARCYRRAFDDHRDARSSQITATLSAAVVFAHVRFPLGQAIAAAHRLLDDVAKDANGRDSLAASVLKPGGLHCQWTTTWRRLNGNGSGEDAVNQLEELRSHLADADDEPGVSSGLLYRIRDTLSLLCGLDSWQPGEWGTPPDGLDWEGFVRAEVVQSLSKRDEADGDKVARLTGMVCDLLPRSRKGATSNAREIGLDALVLARFLANPQDE